MLGVTTVKIDELMRPYLPYHVKLGNEHRIMYLKPVRYPNSVEWRDWFTDESYGIGHCTKYIGNA